MGSPSGPRALWECALDRVEAISSREMVENDSSSTGY